MDLIFKTKLTSPKISSSQKITNSKAKKKKKIQVQSINFTQNKQPCPLKYFKQNNFTFTQQQKRIQDAH